MSHKPDNTNPNHQRGCSLDGVCVACIDAGACHVRVTVGDSRFVVVLFVECDIFRALVSSLYFLILHKRTRPHSVSEYSRTLFVDWVLCFFLPSRTVAYLKRLWFQLIHERHMLATVLRLFTSHSVTSDTVLLIYHKNAMGFGDATKPS